MAPPLTDKIAAELTGRSVAQASKLVMLLVDDALFGRDDSGEWFRYPDPNPTEAP